MKDMKRTKAERKSSESPMNSSVKGDEYPYGLEVHLDHESLGKLGMHTLPKVGAKLRLYAHAHVTSVEERSTEGKKHRSVRLQLRKMALSGKPQADEAELNKGAKGEMDRALANNEGGKKGNGNYDGAGATDDSEDGSEA
jgi:hypothetical protein